MKKTSAQSLRDDFLAWQCRIRQIAMRQDGGRPSPGMRPRVLDESGRAAADALTVLLVPRQPEESTAFFRFQVMRTADPRDLYERGLAHLQAEYFQTPATFSDTMLAVFAKDSEVAASLIAGGRCTLEFEQFSQSYRLPCKVRVLKPADPSREAAIWHNRLFNPALPDAVHVVAFNPDWASAETWTDPGRHQVS